jgi:cysteine desulfurase
MKIPIYLDYHATTPVDPRVLEVMLPHFSEDFGNAASKSHSFGWRAEEAVEAARAEVGRLIGASAKEIVWTSGATESDNLAIKGAAQFYGEKGRHLVTCKTEHKAVLDSMHALERQGFEVTFLDVEPDGRLDPGRVKDALRKDTILVSLMHANNETGVVQPVREIAELARGRGIVVHTDAAQSVGKIPARPRELGVDLLAVAGHKIYAPKGVGALFLRRGTPFAGFLRGAGHEGGRRAGTENVAGIVGLGAACALAAREMEERALRMAAARDRLESALRASFADLVVHGAGATRLPNTLSAAIPGVDANALLARLDGVAASAGAACHSGGTEPSRVLLAMGVPPDLARCTLRLTTGRSTTLPAAALAATRIELGVRHYWRNTSRRGDSAN